MLISFPKTTGIAILTLPDLRQEEFTNTYIRISKIPDPSTNYNMRLIVSNH